MIQSPSQPVTFEEFIEWKPENRRYELHNGGIIEIAQRPGKHEEVIGFLASELTLEFVRLNLPYLIPKQALVKPSKE
jgi:Uma2 family endonuclease